VHDISVPAFERAGDPDAYPGTGEPWEPLKLYYSAWSRARIVAMHEKFLELDLKSPFEDRWFDRPSQDHLITTKIDVTDFYSARSEALRAHATQIDPTSPFWFGLPDDVVARAYPWEDYQLAGSRVAVEIDGIEDDLFTGLRGEDA
jgi:mycothiol S-conjugate amidase